MIFDWNGGWFAVGGITMIGGSWTPAVFGGGFNYIIWRRRGRR